MLTVLFAIIVVAVILFWWIGSRAYAIAKRGGPARNRKPDDRLLSWREVWILGRRPTGQTVTKTATLSHYEVRRPQR
jgi:hypothetical protein